MHFARNQRPLHSEPLGAARKDEHRGKTKEINPRCKKVSPPCITLNCTGEKLLRKIDNIAVSVSRKKTGDTGGILINSQHQRLLGRLKCILVNIKGRVRLPKRMNFWKNSKRPLTPPPLFRKIRLQFF